MADVRYYLDGVDFKRFGVFVKRSKGLVGRTKAKNPTSGSWKDYHGRNVDLENKYLEERTIRLTCFISSEGIGEFMVGLTNFLQQFDGKGTNRLMVEAEPGKPLVYEVYLEEPVDPDKVMRDGPMVGTFDLVLKEPCPVKRVLRASGSVSISINTEKMVDVYWGDGTSDTDIHGNIQLSHNYKTGGTHYVIIAGCIDEITSMNTNSEILWTQI